MTITAKTKRVNIVDEDRHSSHEPYFFALHIVGGEETALWSSFSRYVSDMKVRVAIDVF